MKLTAGNLDFTFALNGSGSKHVAPITLGEWEPFRSKNTVPGREGQHVLLECPMVYGRLDEGELGLPSEWL